MPNNNKIPPKFHFDSLFNDAARGRLIPVVGGDINLCGRPRSATGLYDDWRDHRQKDEGVYYPPTTAELALHLLRAAKADGYPVPAGLMELIESKGERNPDAILPIGLVNVCQYLQAWDRDWLAGTLDTVFSLTFNPTPAHEFLAHLAAVSPPERDADAYPYPIIVTACFDNVLEKLLEELKQPFHLISFVLDKQGGKFEYSAPGEKVLLEIGNITDAATRQALQKYPVILKLNGGFRTGEERLLVTEDHYIDYLTHKNVESCFPDKLLTMLKKKSSHLLFLGYPLRNWNLRVILRRIWSESLNTDPDSKHWTFIQEDRQDLDDREFWERYAYKSLKLQAENLKTVDMETYVKILGDRLASLAAVQGATPQTQPNSPVAPPRDHIFISYSHKDKTWLSKLKTYLAPVKDKLKTWDDQSNLKPGDKWLDEIKMGLASAKAAIFLVSPDFLASDFIQNTELPELLKAANSGGCKILWVHVRPSRYFSSAFKDYQALHEKPPLSKLRGSGVDEAFNKVVDQLLEILEIRPESP